MAAAELTLDYQILHPVGRVIFALLVVLLGASLTVPSGISVNRRMLRRICWAGEEVEVVGGNNLCVVWKWPGAKTFDLSYRISCPKRGIPDRDRMGGRGPPGGLRQRVRGQAGPHLQFSVVPRTQAIRRVNQVRGRAYSPTPQEDVAILGVPTTDFTGRTMVLRVTGKGGGYSSTAWAAGKKSASAKSAKRSGRNWPMSETTWVEPRQI